MSLEVNSSRPLTSKEGIANKAFDAIERLKVTVVPSPITEEEPVASGVREFVVAFIEPDQMPEAETIEIEPTPPEQRRSQRQILLT